MRVEPFTEAEIQQYNRDGFLLPVRVLSDEQIAELRQALDDHLRRPDAPQRFELTDPIRLRSVAAEDGQERFEYEEGEASPTPHTFPFFMNLWKLDERFRRVATDPVIAGLARQLLGVDEVLLMEDNVVVKNPHSKTLPWHQDYSYWPLAEPAAVTVWIALDHISAANGAMQVVPGSHTLGERLPVAFGDEQAFMHEQRPQAQELSQDPAAEGHQVVTYELQPGECGFHDAMLWHASTPNTTDSVRRAFILRYVKNGTIWLGSARFAYDDIGCGIGEPLSAAHFPLVPTAF